MIRAKTIAIATAVLMLTTTAAFSVGPDNARGQGWGLGKIIERLLPRLPGKRPNPGAPGNMVGAPGPVAGIGLPVLAVTGGLVWVFGRRRRPSDD